MQGKHDEADLLFVEAIAMGEKTLGPEHPDLAVRINNRAVLMVDQVRAVRSLQASIGNIEFAALQFWSCVSWVNNLAVLLENRVKAIRNVHARTRDARWTLQALNNLAGVLERARWEPLEYSGICRRAHIPSPMNHHGHYTA